MPERIPALCQMFPARDHWRPRSTHTVVVSTSPVAPRCPASERWQGSPAAGDRARALSAGAEAVDHYASALALGHPDPARLHEALGDVHTLRGDYAAALAAYDAAAAHAGAERLGGIEHKLAAVHERRGEWEPSERHLQEALALGAPAARVQADRGLVAWRRGDPGALDLCREALRLAERDGDDEAAARAHNTLGLLGERGTSSAASSWPRGCPTPASASPPSTTWPGPAPPRASSTRPQSSSARLSTWSRRRATATARRRCATTSPTPSTAPAATRRRWRS